MSWKKVEREADLFFAGGDPYFQLRTGARRTQGFGSLDSSAWRPVLFRQRAGETAPAEASDFRVPAFYTHAAAGLAEAEHRTALVKRSFIEGLPGNRAISRITVLPPIEGDAVPADPGAARPLSALAGEPADRTIVIGVIDYGIAFAHERFRQDHATTRIAHLWVQDGGSPDPFDRGGAGAQRTAEVNPVPYGRELDAPAIDRLLARLADGRLADEDELYRQVAASELGARWLRSVAPRMGHGTHVMDLACGCGQGQDEQEERERRPIVAVQLPEASTTDTSGENFDAYALDAIRYILDRADAIARQRGCGPLPVVINFSYGNVAGPHDGSSDLEQAIDEVVRLRNAAAPPFALVMPSGNNHLARLHAEFTRPEQKVALSWSVLPDDKTPSFLEIWLPRGAVPSAGSRVELAVATPDGHRSQQLGEDDGAGMQLRPSDEEVLCEVRYRRIPGPSGQPGRGMFLIALQPTALGERAAPLAPSGTWTVELQNRSLGAGDLIEAWVQRDDTPFGFRQRGRQSFLDAPCYRRFDEQGREIVRDEDQPPCHVRRAGSTNAIATGEKPVVVGGFVLKEGRLAKYSSRNSEGAAPVPRYLAPSDDSEVYLGVLAAGTRSGSLVAMNGTSVAAPQVARRIANELVGGGGGAPPPGNPKIGPGDWPEPGPGDWLEPGPGDDTWRRRRPGRRSAESMVLDAVTRKASSPGPGGGERGGAL